MSYADFVAFRRTLPRTPRLERQTVRARGVDFAVYSSAPVGDRPPLICVNGGMLYDHSMLWPALSPLAEARQIILYDQRGRGESSAPANSADASIDDDAADIGALRRALGIRRWDLLGHSWGGGIAMLGAAADPSGVRRMVLIDPVWSTSAWMAPLRRNIVTRLEGAERAAVEDVPEDALGTPDPRLHSRYNRAVYPAWFHDREMARHFTPPEATSETGTAVLARLRRDGYDWSARISALSVPTLVLHGEDDALPMARFPADSYIVPNARLVVIPAAGHMPFWEAPLALFSRIASFL